MNKVRVGIIGCGAISVRRHLPEYAAREDVEIAAIYNRTKSKAEEVQRQYGGVVCDSVEQLVNMDLVHYITGENITEVYAHTATLDKKYPDGSLIDVEDNAWCIYKLGNGATGTMHASWTDYGQEYNSIVIHGTEGSIRCYDDREYSLIVEKKDGRQNFLSTEKMMTNSDQTIGTGENLNSGVIDEFIGSIKGERKCRCTGADALRSMRVIFAAMASSDIGRMISIPENR